MNELPVKNIAFYAFFKPTYDLKAARELLHHQMREQKVKGTILLSLEGINCSLSAATANMDTFLGLLFKTIGVTNPEIKISYSHQIAFKRDLVKVKPFIVAQPGLTPIDLNLDTAPYISPEEFHRWMEKNKEMIVLDTRNDFEYHVGRFKDARHLGTRHFADFEEDLQKASEDWQRTPVVTFCTGGIRCEKAAPLMLKKGFQEVYQLEGGILNYFKKVGQGYFEGDCFVFDERVAVVGADLVSARTIERTQVPSLRGGQSPTKQSLKEFILKVILTFTLLSITSAYAITAEEYVHLGNVSGRQGKYSEALINYTKAIEAEPHDANAYYNRGYINIELRKYNPAIADLDKAIEIDPHYAAAYHIRGVAYFLKKKYPKAIADYTKSIELDPDNLRAYISRLSAYCKTGNNDRAWKDVIKIQQLGGTVNPTIINLLKNKNYRE